MTARGDRPREVLVVDDSKTTSKMVRVILEQIGLAVRVAHSGPEGLAAIAQAVPDLVICDVVMPGMTGLDVIREIRANERTQRLPVILLTSMKALEDRVRGLETGADDYILKPFQIDELRARVRAHLRMKALQDEVSERNAQLESARKLLSEKLESLRMAYQRIAEEDARRRHDLALAAKVQHGLLPRAFPPIRGLAFHARFDPALAVAGDFYDVFTLPDGRVAIVVGDVAGKGIPASLVMVLVQTLVRTEAMTALSPAVLLERVNLRLIRELASPNAVTLFAGFLDGLSGVLAFSNGGHEYPLLGRHTAPGSATGNDGALPMELCVGGPFLGVFPHALYNEGQVQISAGDRLFLFTDGIYNLRAQEGPLATSEAVARHLQLHASDPTEALMAGMTSAQGDVEAPGTKDDVTILAMDCLELPAHAQRASVSIYNDPVNLREVVAFARDLARRMGLEEQVTQDLLAGLSEVVGNAISHAYAHENVGHVGVDFAKEPQGLVITVEDQGRGFDPASIGQAASSAPGNQASLTPCAPAQAPGVAGDPGAGGAARGLHSGLATARRLADRFQIESRKGKGTRVVFEKYIPH